VKLSFKDLDRGKSLEKDCLNKMLNNFCDAVLMNSMILALDEYTVIRRFRESGKTQGKIIDNIVNINSE
jgi:hypothetical protein